MRQSEALQEIHAVIKARGGEVTHNDLVADLQAAGKGAAVAFLMGFTRSGAVLPDVRASANPGVPPVLWYTVGGND